MDGTTSVSGTTASTTNSSSQSSSSAATSAMDMNKDMYLKLFLENLQNQNPFQTMDSSEMMQQMSQLGFMEQVEGMKSAVESLTSMNTRNSFIQGTDLLGKDVTYQMTDGTLKTGTPTSIRLENGTVQYLIDNNYIPAASVSQVNLPKETTTTN